MCDVCVVRIKLVFFFLDVSFVTVKSIVHVNDFLNKFETEDKQFIHFDGSRAGL